MRVYLSLPALVLCLLILSGLICVGCSRSSDPSTANNAPNPQQPAPAATSPTADSRTVSPGDFLSIEVADLYESGKRGIVKATIDPSGGLKISELPSIHAAGLTPQQLSQKIDQATTEWYRQNTPNRGQTQVSHPTKVTLLPTSPKLAPGDYIAIDIYDLIESESSWSWSRQSITLPPDGTVEIAEIGKIAAAGLAPDQLAEKLGRMAMNGKSHPKRDHLTSPPDIKVTLVISTTNPSTGPAPAKLSDGDTINVEIFELVTPGTMWSQSLTIDAHGNITLPYFGTIRAAGLTTDQLVTKIGYIIGEHQGFRMMTPPPLPLIKVTRQSPATSAPATAPASDPKSGRKKGT